MEAMQMDQAAEQAFQEREQRLVDAVQLKTPDRVPVSMGLNYFPAKFTGTTTWAAYYDFPDWKQAYIKAAQYYEPIVCSWSRINRGTCWKLSTPVNCAGRDTACPATIRTSSSKGIHEGG